MRPLRNHPSHSQVNDIFIKSQTITTVASLNVFTSLPNTVDTPPTPCQLDVEKALQTPYSSDQFVPRCKKDGNYEEVQCSDSTGECWCVDSLGVELRGTRSQDIVTCPGMGMYYSEVVFQSYGNSWYCDDFTKNCSTSLNRI